MVPQAFEWEKLKTDFYLFFVAVVLCDMEMYLYSASYEFKRSGTFSDLGQRSLVCCMSTFSKVFFSETTWSSQKLLGQFQLNLIYSLQEERKLYIFGPGHMTKIATMSIYVENLKKSSPPKPLG